MLSDLGHQVWACIRPGGNSGGLLDSERLSLAEVDAENWEEIDSFFLKLKDDDVALSGVAVCIGSILLKPAHLTRREEFDFTLNRNLGCAFGVVRAACRHFMKTGGSIALVSSAVASHGYANHEAIAAAKGGIEALVRSAASTYSSSGIRVNAVAPGLVETPLSEKIVNSDAAYESSRKMHALGRIGQPDDVASAIAWLLDSRQSWVTGQIIGVDGGLSRVNSRAV